MLATELPSYFQEIGARLVVSGSRAGRRNTTEWIGPVEVNRVNRTHFRRVGRPYILDIGHDAKGEHFTLTVTPEAPDFRILQVRRDERHLLLYAAGNRNGTNVGAERFLCGHDERHWFVSAVGEPVSTVMAARKALLPKELRHKGLNKSVLTSRHNDVFIRQGEWFFVRVTDPKLLAQLNDMPIHSHEPIQRGTRNKPHMVDEVVRFGGTEVVLAGGKEYSVTEWENLMRDFETRKNLVGVRAERRTKDMTVYCRGAVRHADHATIVLDGWHSVFVNGEIVSSNVVFYD